MTRKHELGLLAATILGSSMVFIDSTVVNVALPAIQASFRADVGELQWVVEAYALVLAALILVGGALGDRVGRRRVFQLGNALFAASSLWCGLAPSVEQLVVARGAQGLGGALLAPSSLALITAAFPDPERRGRAIGTWSGWTAITMAIGPLLGGVLIDRASWRWAFLINPPIAVAVAWLARRCVGETRDEQAAGRIDWPGAAAAVLCLGALVWGLVRAGERGFADPAVQAALAGAMAAGAAFVWREARAAHPMMPFGIFRSRVFLGANALTLFLYAALAGVLFFLPLRLVQVHGTSATVAGAAMLPLVAALFLLSPWAGRLPARFGARTPLTAGPAVAGVGFSLFALPDASSAWWLLLPAVCVLGVGMGITVAPLTATVLGALERRHAGLASGVNNAVARVAAVLAIAVFGLLALLRFESALAERLAATALPDAQRERILAQSERLAAIEPPPGAAPDARRAIDAAFVAAFRTVAAGCALLAFASAAFAFRILPGRGGSGDAAELRSHARTER